MASFQVLEWVDLQLVKNLVTKRRQDLEKRAGDEQRMCGHDLDGVYVLLKPGN